MKKRIVEKPAFDAEGYQVNLHDLNGEALPKPALKFKPFKQGSARAGAGRKPLARVPVTLRLHPAVIKALRAKAERKSLSTVAEERLALA